MRCKIRAGTGGEQEGFQGREYDVEMTGIRRLDRWIVFITALIVFHGFHGGRAYDRRSGYESVLYK